MERERKMNKVNKMNNMNNEHATLLCRAINTFGDGQHPVAELSTIEYFNKEYSIECIEIAQKSIESIRNKPADKIVMMLNEIKNSLI
tara:strand:- start:17 stop:277 length:261 start_codon:yes stop_codon:yes gene_type:complete